MTVMSGSVVTRSAGKPKQAKPKKRATSGKENAAPKRASRRAAATGGEKQTAKTVTGNMLEGFANEDSVGNTTVDCTQGVRCKLWLDDLLACVNHVISQVAKQGPSEDDLTKLKVHLLRTGILFALTGSVVLQTEKGSKSYKKWSALRPALSEHALWHSIQAGLVST